MKNLTESEILKIQDIVGNEIRILKEELGIPYDPLNAGDCKKRHLLEREFQQLYTILKKLSEE